MSYQQAATADTSRYPICTCGKIALDKKSAQTKRNWLLKKGSAKDLRIYQCDFSNCWHLTKQV